MFLLLYKLYIMDVSTSTEYNPCQACTSMYIQCTGLLQPSTTPAYSYNWEIIKRSITEQRNNEISKI